MRLVRATDEPTRFGASAALLLARLPPRRRVRANEGGAVNDRPCFACLAAVVVGIVLAFALIVAVVFA